jgi:hypothetical protein
MNSRNNLSMEEDPSGRGRGSEESEEGEYG